MDSGKAGKAPKAPKVLKTGKAPGDQLKKAKMGEYDKVLVLNWLEDETNRNKLEGVEGKTRVGVPPIVKAKAYQELDDYINEKQLSTGTQLRKIDGSSMKSRFLHLLRKYRDMKNLTSDTGFGLTEEDAAKKVTTIEEKLEHIFPGYGRFDAMYGYMPNVAPRFTHGSKIQPGSGRFAWETIMGPSLAEDRGVEDDIMGSGVWSTVQHDELRASSERCDDVQVDELPNVGGQGSKSPTPKLDKSSPGETLQSPVLQSPVLQSPVLQSQFSADNENSGKSPYKVGDKYPNQKHILETRHSINSAYAENLHQISQSKGKLADLKCAELEMNRTFQTAKLKMESDQWESELVYKQGEAENARKKLELEVENLQFEQEFKVEEAAKDRVERETRYKQDGEHEAKLESTKMKVALLSSGRPLSELKEVFAMLKEL